MSQLQFTDTVAWSLCFRNAYRTLLALLGDAGQAEMIVLEED